MYNIHSVWLTEQNVRSLVQDSTSRSNSDTCGDVENPQKVSIGRPSDCPVYGSRLHSTRHQQQDSENKVGLMYNIVDQLIDLKYVLNCDF